MNDLLTALLSDAGMTDRFALILSKVIIIAGILIIAFLANLIAKRVILRIIHKIVEKTKTVWDDIIFERGVLTKLSHLAPALVVYFLIKIAFPHLDSVVEIIQRIVVAYMIGIVVLIINSILNAGHDIYSTYEVSKSRPIKGYIQVVKIFIILIGLILIVTTLLNKSPLGILSGIGALSAVLMLVFKDSILGLVASIQLTANNMVRIGDWIEMPAYSADGDIIDINLQSIKVQNWDKTISSIPIYALISSSFKNWRGMQESGGRRIKRSINIDMRSIRFCTEEMLQKYRKINVLHDYIEGKTAEIDEYNSHLQVDAGDLLNGRHLTNVGTFRIYLVEYLKHHPKIHKDMTFLVRQLSPGKTGLPIEIYVFSNDQAWANYETIQADIFDHVLAVLPEFDLKIYQDPSGSDLQLLAETGKRQVP